MADTVINVRCGFFDAVNNDRTYSADDMNRPYKRVVSDGVFASQSGTPNTDLLVEAVSGMTIRVQSGDAIFGGKWFENPTAISVTVANNTSLNPRTDSIIAQVDMQTSGRVGNIIYRTGTPVHIPSPPALSSDPNVIEYRIANIHVASGATSITNANISDLRGSSSCPWVTGLIDQVDTSTLWAQYQSAYQNQYEVYGQEFSQYIAAQRQAWDDFLATLSSELSVATNIVTLTGSTVTSETTSTMPVGLVGYNPATDALFIYINGMLATYNAQYTISGNTITFINPLPAGQTVTFVALHSIVAADMESTVSMYQVLNDRLSAFMSDSGWVSATLAHGTAYDSSHVPAFRNIGGKVYFKGAVKGAAIGDVLFTLPPAYFPDADYIFSTSEISGTAIESTVAIKVSAQNGQVSIMAGSAAIGASSMIPLDGHFLSTNAVTSVLTNLENADEVEY